MTELLVSRDARVTQSHMLLHCAVTQANRDIARLLLNARSVPNLRDDHGNTPLLLASKQVFALVKILMMVLMNLYILNSNSGTVLSNSVLELAM